MARLFDVITFDCYGTLIDWETGIAEAFRMAAERDGIRLDRDDVLSSYSAVEPLVEQERYRTYREVLTETAARVAHMHGWALSYPRAGFLAESLPSWPPFPDTNRALERLADSGHQLGLLTNCDDDLIAATRKHFTVDFALVVTAQQVHAYKPAPPHFIAAREKIGDARWLHAAQSNFHDIVPTNLFNIPNAWINRKKQPPLPGGIPGREFEDMTGLADWLAQ
jgi:2-haloacid dehalogenase/putative hydrolase of the HAD superfamily